MEWIKSAAYVLAFLLGVALFSFPRQVKRAQIKEGIKYQLANCGCEWEFVNNSEWDGVRTLRNNVFVKFKSSEGNSYREYALQGDSLIIK